MAERRMFAKSIIDTDAFLSMPLSTQALYFHLCMRADDDGFVSNPRKIQRMISCTDDDLKLLVAKRYILVFESGVIVIKHWRIHNYVRKDTYRETLYSEEKATLYQKHDGAYTDHPLIEASRTRDEPVDGSLTQDRLGKDRLELGKNKESKEKTGETPCPYSEIQNLYSSICKSYPKLTKLSDARKKAIKARFNAGYVLDDFKRLFEMAESSTFLKGKNNRNWQATFDWLLKDANMAKVLDGNYNDKMSGKSAGRATTFDIEEYERESMNDTMR